MHYHDIDQMAAVAPSLPNWFDRHDETVRDMLGNLRFLCCLQRYPHRGERCPGMDEGQNRHRTREQRHRDTWTNLDHGVDFLTLGCGLPREFEYAVGCVARAAMPRQTDPELREEIFRRIPTITDWNSPAARQVQFELWAPAVSWCAERRGNVERLALEVLTVTCFAPEVADAELDFHTLAEQVHVRKLCVLRAERGEDDELFG